MSPSLLTSLIIAGLASFVGWMTRALTGAGAVAATAVGAAVLAGTGWAGGIGLGVFFVTASLVSRLTEGRTAKDLEVRGNRRDPVQVAANGGAAFAGGLLGLLDPYLGLWMVTASLAAAGADTWATSIGMLSRREPVLMHTGGRVPRGTSGAVSPIGSIGGLVGASATAVVVAFVAGDLRIAAWCTAIGTAGMLADSFLGATLQARFHCSACDVPTENQVHRCGETAKHVGGVRWIDNDVVNTLATSLSGLAGLAVAFWYAASLS